MNLKYIIVYFLKKAEILSAVSVRLTKLTGKTTQPIHPKHFLSENPWYISYIKKTDLVLDIGCGNGQNSIKACKKSKKVFGIDYDKDLIKIAKILTPKSLKKKLFFQEFDAQKRLPFMSDYFDKILFLDVLEHLNQRNSIMNEIKRILKPKGLLLLSVPNSQTGWKKLQRSVGINSFSDPDHKIEYSIKELTNFLKKFNFQIIHIGYSTYDTPLRPVIDVIGGFSLFAYKYISKKRKQKALKNPNEASGFEIVAAI